ncbi:DivIVA domain-containing protein [Micrococcoides hystricis]|uniref:DivIVA domain-containing protein n=1 Tax=Micrococcoides hystricis TaxID=1572761 RepID=A0ABV6P8J6_9MICC
MLVLLLVLLVLLLGMAALFLTEKIALPTATTDVPENAYRAVDAEASIDDLAATKFSVALRGYRMDQVDAVMDVLHQRIQRQEAELSDLRKKITETEESR